MNWEIYLRCLKENHIKHLERAAETKHAEIEDRELAMAGVLLDVMEATLLALLPEEISDALKIEIAGEPK